MTLNWPVFCKGVIRGNGGDLGSVLAMVLNDIFCRFKLLAKRASLVVTWEFILPS